MTAPPLPAPANRLAGASSPYLRQHADNPVLWQPWDDAALHRARAAQQPIFLSIGYAACHWCHVMAHESFEDATVAAFLNAHFVCIKVDREERPDLDALYMTAVQAMTGTGGWPLSVFLTPDLKPFYGGTYFPPVPHGGLPSFRQVIESVAGIWARRRSEVEASADELRQAIYGRIAPAPPAAPETWTGLRDAALARYAAEYDRTWGGFGGAPKFPPCAALSLLLQAHARYPDAARLGLVEGTLQAMAAGGIFDHLGGGFHRYSVDEQWRVPHFEKMLYDNAQLARLYVEAAQVTGNPAYATTATRTLDAMLRDLASPEGAFYASQDADSGGHEGRYYVWTAEEIEAVLGRDDAHLFCAAYGVTPQGNVEGGHVLHRVAGPAAERETHLARLRAALLAARGRRVPPATDDKLVTAWNALAVSALARAGRALGDDRYVAAAVRAGRFLRQALLKDGVLHRVYARGAASIGGFLEDYACTVNAWLDLYETTYDDDWWRAAADLCDRMIARFRDPAGAFFCVAEDAASPLARLKRFHDEATPAGNASAALALLRLAALTDRAELRALAEETLAAVLAGAAPAPTAFAASLAAADFARGPVWTIVVAGRPGAADTAALRRVLHAAYLPRAVTAATDPDADGGPVGTLPLARGKMLVNGRAAAYVCVGTRCEVPVTDPQALAARLRAGDAG